MSLSLESLIVLAQKQGASDLHLEPGLPAALRVRGALIATGEPLASKDLAVLAQEWIGPEQWPRFAERRSFDFSKTIAGVRCRINILHTSRGIGLAVRLLASFQACIPT
jgi:Tfp pilus assembly pilus retraction ATPase PilT